MDFYPDFYKAVTTINSSATVVSATTSKVTLDSRPSRQYMRLTNIGPTAQYLAFKSTDAVKGSNFRLATGETFESSPMFGNRITDTVSVMCTTSSSAHKLLKMECY